MTYRVLVVDYDAGNMRSVVRALSHIGAEPVVSADPEDVLEARAVVLPGVGAAADCMQKLRERGLIEPLREYVRSGRPLLGVCMGLHALLETSDENDGTECLGILPASAHRFPYEAGRKVPHMGWNTVRWLRDHPVVEGIPSDSYFYFVHSYYPATADAALALGETEYGITFPSVLARDNIVATQFHPEKSGEDGLAIYRNFVAWAQSDAFAPAASALA
ncbi:MAG: imidazole glycerol phosphate synthase subunit HisH [Dehalococcoidia bacterium]